MEFLTFRRLFNNAANLAYPQVHLFRRDCPFNCSTRLFKKTVLLEIMSKYLYKRLYIDSLRNYTPKFRIRSLKFQGQIKFVCQWKTVAYKKSIWNQLTFHHEKCLFLDQAHRWTYPEMQQAHRWTHPEKQWKQWSKRHLTKFLGENFREIIIFEIAKSMITFL